MAHISCLLFRGNTAAMREWRKEEATAAPQALPKRGDAWALSKAELQFMKEGHVYFTDSVRRVVFQLRHSIFCSSFGLSSVVGDQCTSFATARSS